ncbi:MAG: DUF1360 domain-containing protein [candidate division Zixibacteria bacterium]|nr:DUF1360 domain-containing protein [candidate division Zixibacteria bacterium]
MIFNAEPLNLFIFVLSSLAAWRLTLALCFEEGPFGSLLFLRKVLYRIKLNKLIDCPHCTGFWISLIVVLAVYRIQSYSVLLVLAVSGAVSLLHKLTQVDSEQEIEEIE